MIRGTDSAIWERIRLVPFDVTIPKEERDINLLAKLKEELPGGLARAIQGCLEWLDDGLREPKEVRAATENYRNESDPIQRFIDDCCLVEHGTETPAAELRIVYETWCKENGEEPLRQRVIADRLKALGCESKRGTGGHYRWVGMGIVK